jgi:hypothetical protein
MVVVVVSLIAAGVGRAVPRAGGQTGAGADIRDAEKPRQKIKSDGRKPAASPIPALAPLTVGLGPASWIWVGAVVAGPAAGLAAAVLLLPIDVRAAMSLSWIQGGAMLVVVVTAGAVLTLARARASAAGDPLPAAHRVWQVWWLLVALLAVVVLLKPWSPFGPNPEAFDDGWRVPRDAIRLQGLGGAAALLGLVAGVIWAVWSAAAWLRGRRNASGGPRGRFGRAVVVLALCAWLILGIMSLGAVRLYHRYDARLQELTILDLQDEVAAWVGPSWQRAFFPAS